MSCHSNRVDTEGGKRRQGRRRGRALKLSYRSILEHASSREAWSGTPSKNLARREGESAQWMEIGVDASRGRGYVGVVALISEQLVGEAAGATRGCPYTGLG